MSGDEDLDTSLLARMAVGDASALAGFYDRHAPRMLGLAIKLLGNRVEAQDLLHDVFLEVWRKANDYDPQRGSVRAWLATRTRSRALDRIKSAARRHNVPLEDAPERRAAAEPVDDHERIRTLLLQMPETQREVLLLAYFADLSSQEIADQLGLPVGTVKSRTRAGLAALRSMLVERNDG